MWGAAFFIMAVIICTLGIIIILFEFLACEHYIDQRPEFIKHLAALVIVWLCVMYILLSNILEVIG